MKRENVPLDPAQQRRVLELQAQVEELTREVDALQRKLGDLHATDISSLRRAYKSLAQHVQALGVESKHLPGLLDRATEPAVNPEWVAQQTKLVATVTALVYGFGRLLRAARVPDAGPLGALAALLGAGYVGVRLLVAVVSRVGAAAARRHSAEQQLRADLQAVLERIQLMTDLADSGLRLHRMHPSQQHSLQNLQQQRLPPPPPPPLPPPYYQQPPYQQQQQQQQGRGQGHYGYGQPPAPAPAAAGDSAWGRAASSAEAGAGSPEPGFGGREAPAGVRAASLMIH